MAKVLELLVSQNSRRAHRSVNAALQVAYAKRVPCLVRIEPGQYAEQVELYGSVALVAAQGRGTVFLDFVGHDTIRSHGLVTLTDLTIRSWRNGGAPLHVIAGSVNAVGCTFVGHDRVAVNGKAGTTLALSGCAVPGAALVTVGARVTVDACEFPDSVANSVSVDEGSHLTMSRCTVRNSSIHGVRVTGRSEANITESTFTAGSNAAIAVDGGSKATISSCLVEANPTSGVFVEASSAVISGCRLTDTKVGVEATSSAVVRIEQCRMEDSRDTAITVHRGARASVHGGSIHGGAHGVYVNAADAKLDGLEIHGVETTALQLSGTVKVSARNMLITEGDYGLICSDDGTAGAVELDHVRIRGVRRDAVTAGAGLRVIATDTEVTDSGRLGFAAIGNGRLKLTRCTALRNATGVWAEADASIIARTLQSAHNEQVGLCAVGRALVDIAESTIVENGSMGVHLADQVSGRIRATEVSRNSGEDVVNDSDAIVEPSDAAVAQERATSVARNAPQSDLALPDAGDAADKPSAPGALRELDELTGLAPVKQQIRSQLNLMAIAHKRRSAGLAVPAASRHLVFAGPPGTGKTTVGRLYARVLAESGIIASSTLIEVSRSDLVGEHVGETARKTRAQFERAMGGVLFIDEAYTLARTAGGSADFGQEAIDELVKLMEDHRTDVVVIAAGYEAEMRTFLGANPGLESRFSKTILFPAYTPAELVLILLDQAKRHDYLLSESAVAAATRYFQRAARHGQPSGRDARTLFESMTERQAERLAAAVTEPDIEQLRLLSAEDVADAQTQPRDGTDAASDTEQTASLVAELGSMLGLTEAKREIRSIVAELEIAAERRAAGYETSVSVHNLVFAGPPGTGKTTVARLYARLLASLGVLPGTATFVEVSRVDLVAGFVGQTALRTREKFEQARGGVLFIDEAYALAAQPGHATHDFGTEALDTLMKLMEDFRDEVVVIAAGYPEKMRDFLITNPGLASRFATTIMFPDYSLDELETIFTNAVAARQYECGNDTVSKARSVLDQARQSPFFGNARTVRTLVDRAIKAQATRLSDSRDTGVPHQRQALALILPEDVATAGDEIKAALPEDTPRLL